MLSHSNRMDSLENNPAPYDVEVTGMCITPLTCGVKAELIGGWCGDLLGFLMKAVSAWCHRWSEEGQGNTCNQTVCVLDTLDLHLEAWSGKQFPF
ncbi:hypothetical protein TNCV_185251 [Trichonephila clavipes]|nr:hypothetical protein TNCV_185251 [Trichonephila clavipes]